MWPSRKIGDVCEVIPGFAFKSTELGDQGIPVVKIGNITNGLTVDLQSAQRIQEGLNSEKFEKFLLKNGDILLAMTGATAGKVGRVRCSEDQSALLNQRVAKLRPVEIDGDFLWCIVSMDRYRTIFHGLGGGAAQPNMSGSQIESVEIPYPPPSVQSKVAGILTAYDDLIENNRRRIQLLEDAARLLYKEWFINLKFPGHEHVRIKNGVPEGWNFRPLAELAFLTMGQSPSSIHYNQEGDGLPFHQGVTDFGFRFPRHKTFCTAKGRFAEPGDILFSVRAPVGRINVSLDRIIIGRGIAAIRSSMRLQHWTLYALKNHFFKEDLIGEGAIFAAITRKDLKDVALLVPSKEILTMFEQIAKDFNDQMTVIHRFTVRLTEARDLLLPRLMNGDLSL